MQLGGVCLSGIGLGQGSGAWSRGWYETEFVGGVVAYKVGGVARLLHPHRHGRQSTRLQVMARSSKRGSFYADLERLRNTFSSLDPENTGYIGYDELIKLAQTESGMDESMVPELLERLDRDKDGKVRS